MRPKSLRVTVADRLTLRNIIWVWLTFMLLM
jgi:hypothetical protein